MGLHKRFKGLVDLEILKTNRKVNDVLLEVSRDAGVPIETVRNIYYDRVKDHKLATVEKLAEYYNLGINCMIGKCNHTKEERDLLQYFRLCGPNGKSLILLTAKFEGINARADREGENHEIPCLVPTHDIRHGIIYEQCGVEYVWTSVKEAYTGIIMPNNDLIPKYCKDDLILIENRFPSPGEYGVFYQGKRAYIRQYLENNGQYILKCLHGYAEDIILTRLDSIEYVGTCIGVMRDYKKRDGS